MDQTSIVLDDVKVEFDLEAIGRKMRTRSSARAETLLRDLSREAEPIAKPRAAAKLCAVTVVSDTRLQLDGQAFDSPLLIENMGELGRAFPYLATEGDELAEWGRSFSGMERLFANAIQNAAMKQTEALLEKKLRDQFGITQLSAMNPGSLMVWPITQQTPLFELLAPLPEKLGITLLPTFMMKPEQTVSGIFFQTDKKFFSCQLCPRDDCPNRKAPRTAA